MKELNTKLSVYELTQLAPDIIDIMAELGFKDILLPGMIQTAGKFMTLKKGADLRKIPWAQIEKAFALKGYTLV